MTYESLVDCRPLVCTPNRSNSRQQTSNQRTIQPHFRQIRDCNVNTSSRAAAMMSKEWDSMVIVRITPKYQYLYVSLPTQYYYMTQKFCLHPPTASHLLEYKYRQPIDMSKTQELERAQTSRNHLPQVTPPVIKDSTFCARLDQRTTPREKAQQKSLVTAPIHDGPGNTPPRPRLTPKHTHAHRTTAGTTPHATAGNNEKESLKGHREALRLPETYQR